VGFPFAISLKTTTFFIKVLILTKLIIKKYLPTIKFLLLFLNISLLILNRLN